MLREDEEDDDAHGRVDVNVAVVVVAAFGGVHIRL